MVLRKKRYRDLKKVGIGGFLAKTRTPKTTNKKDPKTEDEDKKKRPVWRPKKNKILVQYPEYIQEFESQRYKLISFNVKLFLIVLYRIVILRPDPDIRPVIRFFFQYNISIFEIAKFLLIFILGRNNTRQQHPIQHQHILSEF